jgi:glycosyltransferase involved in cell wall biosynthesis
VEKVRQFAPGLHMLIVDDNSPDGTGELADEFARQYPEEVFVLHRARKEGLGKAYVDAFTQVLKKDYEYILQMDADLSHDPVHLPSFFEKIKDHDLVVGSRYLNGISVVNWDLTRLILSKLASNYVRFILQRLCFSGGNEIQGFSQRSEAGGSSYHLRRAQERRLKIRLGRDSGSNLGSLEVEAEKLTGKKIGT